MAGIDGRWACSVDSPLGAMAFTLMVARTPTGFAGTVEGATGRETIAGEVDGDTLAWTMKVTRPMTLALACTATIAGDALSGKVSAGAFGGFPLTGARS